MRCSRLGPTDFGATPAQWDDWRWQYAHRLVRTRDLDRIPWLGTREKADIARVLPHYPFAVTPYFLSLVQWEDPSDPIRLQALPSPAEIAPGNRNPMDPLREAEHTRAPGLIHRYPDRVVILASHRCAVRCRHCFRKRLWVQGRIRNDQTRWDRVAEYLHHHDEIRDVLLSGGDPLTLPDRQLDRILARIRQIGHVEIVRIGSRIPAVLPQRITPSLCRVLERHAPLWVVTQFNHPREITPETARACEMLLRSGVPVNNQTVLLRGVNDDPSTIRSLCEGLLRIRVRPYYLHQCDRVAGAEHFRTPLHRGIEIIDALQGHTSGLAIPRFVVDMPGSSGKVPLAPGYVLSCRGRRYLLRSYSGELFSYEDPQPGGKGLSPAGT